MTEENYLVGTRQTSCLDGVINSTTTSTGIGWNRIGRDRRVRSWDENMCHKLLFSTKAFPLFFSF